MNFSQAFSRMWIASLALSAAAWCQKPPVQLTPMVIPTCRAFGRALPWFSGTSRGTSGKGILYRARSGREREKGVGHLKLGAPGGQAREHYDMSQYGLDLSQVKVASTLRTSLIVGPDGRIPPLTADAKKRLPSAPPAIATINSTARKTGRFRNNA